MSASSHSAFNLDATAILVSQLGGLGDMVLVSHLVAALKIGRPSASVVLACRRNLAGIVPLFPLPPDRVIELDFNPYEWCVAGPELLAALRGPSSLMADLKCSVYIAAEYQPTWFAWYLAAHLHPPKAFAATHLERPAGLLDVLLAKLDLAPRNFEAPAVAPDLIESERYTALEQYLDLPAAAMPSWTRPPMPAASQIAAFNPGQYLLCFPLGAAGISVKRWPIANFEVALQSIYETSRIPVLLTGDLAEAEPLRLLKDSLNRKQVPAELFLGGPGDLVLLSALVAHAKAYLGNDTGPMHLAAAYGVPGVAVFGGGHWPAYRAAAPGSIAAVHPLPCFGCNWNCVFGHGVCVESVPVAGVVEALRDLLQPAGHPASILSFATLSPGTVQLIQDANERYRASELDRRDRLASILQLQHNLNQREAELSESRKTAERRQDAIVELTNIVEVRDNRIDDLEVVLGERTEALRVESQALLALRVEANLRSQGLESLTQTVAQRDQQIDLLSAQLAERVNELHQLDRAVREWEQCAAERGSALDKLTGVIEKLQVQLAGALRLAEERGESLRKSGELLQLHLEESEERRRGLERFAEHTQLISREAEQRLRDVEVLTLAVAEREGRLQRVESEAAERLKTVVAGQGIISRVTHEAEQRLQNIHTLTEIVAQRNGVIVQLEEVLRHEQNHFNRLITEAGAECAKTRRHSEEYEIRYSRLLAERTGLQVLLRELREEIKELDGQLIAFEQENLYNFVIRLAHRMFGKAPHISPQG